MNRLLIAGVVGSLGLGALILGCSNGRDAVSQALQPEPTVVCHLVQGTVFETLFVPAEELETHLAHGDTPGACPGDDTDNEDPGNDDENGDDPGDDPSGDDENGDDPGDDPSGDDENGDDPGDDPSGDDEGGDGSDDPGGDDEEDDEDDDEARN